MDAKAQADRMVICKAESKFLIISTINHKDGGEKCAKNSNGNYDHPGSQKKTTKNHSFFTYN